RDSTFGCRAGQNVVFVGPWRPRPAARNRLALFVDEQDRVSSALVAIGEVFSDHEAVSIEPGAVADSIASIGGLIVVGRIPLHAQVCAPRLIPLPHGGCQSLANPIRGHQAAQVASFALGARDKKTHAGARGIGRVTHSVRIAGDNDSQRRYCKQQAVKFHKMIPLTIRSGPAFRVCSCAESDASSQHPGRLLNYDSLAAKSFPSPFPLPIHRSIYLNSVFPASSAL